MKILNIVSIIGLAFIATACGNIHQGSDDLRTDSFGQLSDAESSNPYLSSAQQCSENPNIYSNDYQYATQSQFRACKGTTDNNVTVKLFTVDGTTKNVCVFAVRVTGNSSMAFIVNPYAAVQSRYAVKCVSVNSTTGSTVDFGSLPLNGIFVVDQTKAALFAEGLAYGDVRSFASSHGFTYSQGTL